MRMIIVISQSKLLQRAGL